MENNLVNNRKIQGLMVMRNLYHESIQKLFLQQDKIDKMIIESKNKRFNMYSTNSFLENKIFHDINYEKYVYEELKTESDTFYKKMEDCKRSVGDSQWIV
jgi:hypothetical protein